MPKPDPALLDPSHCPFQCEIALRVSDLDVNQHVNNVALVEILQEGRSRFHRTSYTPLHSGEYSLMVASLSVDFLGECHYGAPVFCHSGITRVGRTSQTINQLLVQDDRIVTFCEVVMVSTNQGRPAPHPDGFENGATQWMIAR